MIDGNESSLVFHLEVFAMVLKLAKPTVDFGNPEAVAIIIAKVNMNRH